MVLNRIRTELTDVYLLLHKKDISDSVTTEHAAHGRGMPKNETQSRCMNVDQRWLIG